MASFSPLASRRSASVEAAIVGGLAAGALDITYAIVASGLRGIPPQTVLQSVASGLLGRESYRGGIETASLGFVLHFLMTTAMAGAYVAAGRRFPTLLRRPMLWGPAYGLGIYFVMNYVVLPLSAVFPARPFLTPPAIGGLAIHALGVGLPIAIIAHQLQRRRAAA